MLEKGEENVNFIKYQKKVDGKDQIDDILNSYDFKNLKVLMSDEDDHRACGDEVFEDEGENRSLPDKACHEWVQFFAAKLDNFKG